MPSIADDLASIPGRALSLVSFAGLVLIALAVGFLSLFLVHQISLWISLDPVRAFHGVKTLVGGYVAAYDTTANLWNGFAEVLLVAIPGWNAAAMYVVQPLVFTALDVLSIAFMQRPYTGVITEESVPYEGHGCPPDGSLDSASEWCGEVSFYSAQLGVASGSPSSFIGNSTVTLSTRTARRLAEAMGEPLVGVLDLSVLVDALQSLLGSAIVLMGSLSDVVFHVAWTVLSEVFEVIFNLVMEGVKAISGMVMMLIRSGVLTTVLKIGMDLLVVMITDILLPYLFAMLNAVVCLLDYTQVAGWGEQIRCISKVCFLEGSDVFGEVFHTFSSIPHIASVIQGVVSKLSNRNTGQRYASSSSGPIDLPEVSAGSEETPRTHACGECFNCKVCGPTPPPHPSTPLAAHRLARRRSPSSAPSSCWSAASTDACSTAKSTPAAWRTPA